MSPARLRPLAEADLVERTRYYRLNAGDDVASRFFDAAIDALSAIEGMPGTGSLKVGELCDIPGLRVRRIAQFPCGWFYVAPHGHIGVVRLLADAQDLTAVLNAFDEQHFASIDPALPDARESVVGPSYPDSVVGPDRSGCGGAAGLQRRHQLLSSR